MGLVRSATRVGLPGIRCPIPWCHARTLAPPRAPGPPRGLRPGDAAAASQQADHGVPGFSHAEIPPSIRLALRIQIRTEPARREGLDRNERRGGILDVVNRGVRQRARTAAGTATGEFESVVLGTCASPLPPLIVSSERFDAPCVLGVEDRE
jgi:hypothetical protein